MNITFFFLVNYLKKDSAMSSKPSRNLPSVKVYKGIFDAECDSKQAYSETVQLYQNNVLKNKPIWFKGSRDRGLKGDLAA